jgi:hypothetical protein
MRVFPLTVRRTLRGAVLRLLFPLLMVLGTIFKSRKEGYRRTIIHLNNTLVRGEKIKTKKILLLLPHCLQRDECAIRLTHNIHNCKRCGRCEIADLIEIAENNRLDIFVATGGTLARKVVTEVRPGAIVAVACERDLSGGLADIYPAPIIGIINERPHGPCVNTKVDLAMVKEAIAFFS